MTFKEICEEVAGQAGANRTDSDAVKAWTEAGFKEVENRLAVRLEYPILDETISNCIILGAVTASMRQAGASDWRIYLWQFEEAVRFTKARMEREVARFPVGPTDPLVNLAWSSVLEKEAEENFFFRTTGPDGKGSREASRGTAQYNYGTTSFIASEEILTRADEVSGVSDIDRGKDPYGDFDADGTPRSVDITGGEIDKTPIITPSVSAQKAASVPPEPRPHRQPRPVEEEVLDEQPVRMRRRPEREDHE